MSGARARPSKVVLGLLRLTDAAPAIIAREMGAFAEEGLEVELSIEPSWANVADKIAYGLIDGAVMLPPLALAVSLGLRGARAPLVVPMSLSLKGNTITLAERSGAVILGSDGGESPVSARAAAQRFAMLIRDRARARLGLAVVHVYSTHNLLLRYWLAAGGLDPDRDVELTVVPPAQTVEALRTGRIVGFCAGAPWGVVAARTGIGRTVAVTSEIWNNHPEKVLALGARWAEENPDRLQRLLRALLRAARYCDDAANALAVAALVARTLALDPEPCSRRCPARRRVHREARPATRTSRPSSPTLRHSRGSRTRCGSCARWRVGAMSIAPSMPPPSPPRSIVPISIIERQKRSACQCRSRH